MGRGLHADGPMGQTPLSSDQQLFCDAPAQSEHALRSGGKSWQVVSLRRGPLGCVVSEEQAPFPRAVHPSLPPLDVETGPGGGQEMR